MRRSIAALFLLLCPVLTFEPRLVWADSARAMPTPQYHAVPCPRSAPDVLAISWRITRLNTRPNVSAGRRTIRNSSEVRRLYAQICGTMLVKYVHPVAIACPAADGDGNYRLAFSRGGRLVLRATETDEGCRFLWIDGHRNLGYGFDTLFLPAGVPTIQAP